MPCLTISARPERKSRSGSVRATAGSTTTSRGWWNAPIRFFAFGWSIAVLPPMAASTWARIDDDRVGMAAEIDGDDHQEPARPLPAARIDRECCGATKRRSGARTAAGCRGPNEEARAHYRWGIVFGTDAVAASRRMIDGV